VAQTTALLKFGTALPSYEWTVRSNDQPDGTTFNDFTWDTGTPGQEFSPGFGLHVSASNALGLQNGDRGAFLSGLMLGIAGGIFLAIIQELLQPFSRRHDAKFPV